MKNLSPLPALALLLSGVGQGAIAQNLGTDGCDRSRDIPAAGYINNPTCGTDPVGSSESSLAPPPPVAPPLNGGGENGGDTGGDSGGDTGGGDTGGNDSPTGGDTGDVALLPHEGQMLAAQGVTLLADDDFSTIG